MSAERLEQKLQLAKERVLGEFTDSVLRIAVMGSITREASAASDLDVAVVFGDAAYNQSIDSLKGSLARIAGEINRQLPEHELVLWATKADHYRTLLPDVSYIRRNLPDDDSRLDAWCGLAKHTLANYEQASGRLLHGDPDPAPVLARIPRSEAVELFLLSTRTLAEGMVELESDEPQVRHAGVNHVAKAGLRAAYAVLIARDREPRNTYDAISAAASAGLPEHRETIAALYRAKRGAEPAELPLAAVIPFFRCCEQEVATVPRLRMGGLARARAGESFGFQPEDILGTRSAPIESYSRFARFPENFMHSLYFLRTALAIVKRFAGRRMPDAGVLDFYFEELSVLGTHFAFHPFGLRIVVGDEEREEVTLRFPPELPGQLQVFLRTLDDAYGRASSAWTAPWAPLERKVALVRLLLVQLAGFVDRPDPGPTPGESGPGLGMPPVAALQYQCALLPSQAYSPHLLRFLSSLGLALYQAGDLDAAADVLRSALSSAEGREEIRRRGQLPLDDEEEFARLLSTAHHHFALVLHRRGDGEGAREHYSRALDLHPENLSALDDFTVLLVRDLPGDQAVAAISPRLGRFADDKTARRQVANRFMAKAIDLKVNGDLESAAAWYVRSIEADPQHAKAHFNFALLFEARGDDASAARLYAAARSLEPDYVNPYINLARLLERAGQVSEAIDLLTEAVARGIANEFVHANLGNCLRATGDRKGAEGHYRSALEHNPDHPDALNGLGVLLMEEQENGAEGERLVEAVLLFERAYAVDPSFVEARQNAQVALARLLRLGLT